MQETAHITLISCISFRKQAEDASEIGYGPLKATYWTKDLSELKIDERDKISRLRIVVSGSRIVANNYASVKCVASTKWEDQFEIIVKLSTTHTAYTYYPYMRAGQTTTRSFIRIRKPWQSK